MAESVDDHLVGSKLCEQEWDAFLSAKEIFLRSLVSFCQTHL